MQWPASGLPFQVSNSSSDRHYYRINLAQSTQYNLSYDNSNYVTISNADDTKKVWYFEEEVESDPDINNLKYYRIVNAKTGKYLKFTAETINGSNQTNAFKLSDYDPSNADRFKFVVVNSYGGNAGYSIMPKLAMSNFNVNNYANSMVPNSVGNNKKTDLRSDRNNNNAHWVFIEKDPISAPVISFDYSTSKVSITCATTGVTICYTTDGSTPTSSSTVYSAAFEQLTPCTIKAIAYEGELFSAVSSFELVRVATPSIYVENNSIVMSCEDDYDHIYYTIYDTEPALSVSGSTMEYTGPIQDGISNKKIRAKAVKENKLASLEGVGDHLKLRCDKPVISCNGSQFTVSVGSFPSPVTVYYTYGTNPADPTPSSSSTTSSATINITDTPFTVKAYASSSPNPDYLDSEIRTMTLAGSFPSGSGTESDPYCITNNAEYLRFQVTSSGTSNYYKLTNDIVLEGNATVSGTFSGGLEASVGENGIYHTLSGLTEPIFATISNARIKNLNLDAVNISQSGKVGAIAGTVEGSSRIYNVGILGGSVKSTNDCCGGLVGEIKGTSRVVNCYNYADVSGSTYAAGIVGKNEGGFRRNRWQCAHRPLHDVRQRDKCNTHFAGLWRQPCRQYRQVY